MKIQRIAVRNFRSLHDYSLDLNGESRFIIGETAIGKTSLLTAVFRGLGKERAAFTRADFTDVDTPIEIELVLNDFDQELQSVFCERIDFEKNSLTVGVRATWDDADEQVVVEHVYPSKKWIKSTADERNALVAQWFPAERDVGRYLQFGMRRNLLARLVDGLSIENAIEDTSQGMKALIDALGSNEQIIGLLEECRSVLGEMLADVFADVFTVGGAASSGLEILRLLDLSVSHHGSSVPVRQQSSGIGQLTAFAFLIQLARSRSGDILLIDEPESSLHPQAQRSLARLLTNLPCQSLIATHSSNVLDRVDPRTILCLRRGQHGGVHSTQPTVLDETQAKRLARYTTPQTAEAFFSRRVILVEGISDLYAIRILGEKLGRDLDANGITIVDMEGAGGLKTFIQLMGPDGFGIPISGMCDVDQEAKWSSTLHNVGLVSSETQSDMNAAGFFVCNRDLEDELINAYGISETEQLIDDEGEASAFRLFCSEPEHQTKSPIDRIRSFFRKKGRKVRYAPLIVEQLSTPAIPQPLLGVLNHA